MPSSLRFLAFLFGLSVAVAVASGGALYLETRAKTQDTARALTGGSVSAGRAAIGRYQCGGCHIIPGVPGALGQVGPALKGIATRAEIAGHLANDPANMRLWLQHPQHVARGSGMPEQGVTDKDARDIAAYLYTLK